MFIMFRGKKMEIDNTKGSIEGTVNSSENSDLIKVRAILSCSSCGYKKKFRKQFRRSQMEEIMVSIRIFDWMTCSCGDLLDLNLEFNI
ncbi:hypothetical protein LCGC14_0988340 [marine sediment metagenome]|uniref:Uncharacterized protein n=1 Tax=marine sediment metagenome TaxID=412755 RepID=A0A0F9N6F8_9ZZZZ